MTQVWAAAKKRRKLLKRQRGLCAICGLPVGPADATLDHIVPRSVGGGGEIENLRVAHRRCNMARGSEIESVSVEIDGLRVLRAEVHR